MNYLIFCTNDILPSVLILGNILFKIYHILFRNKVRQISDGTLINIQIISCCRSDFCLGIVGCNPWAVVEYFVTLVLIVILFVQTHNGLNIMELESVHDTYKKELERVCEKHQIELDETELRHRNETKRLCAENQSEISNLKQTLKSLYETELDKIKNNHEHEIRELKEQFERHLNDLKDCDLDTLTKRIEDDITKTQTKHKKIVSYLVNEIYKLKKVILLLLLLYVIKMFIIICISRQS